MIGIVTLGVITASLVSKRASIRQQAEAQAAVRA
jgi:putrescine transport system permease protein